MGLTDNDRLGFSGQLMAQAIMTRDTEAGKLLPSIVTIGVRGLFATGQLITWEEYLSFLASIQGHPHEDRVDVTLFKIENQSAQPGEPSTLQEFKEMAQDGMIVLKDAQLYGLAPAPVVIGFWFVRITSIDFWFDGSIPAPDVDLGGSGPGANGR